MSGVGHATKEGADDNSNHHAVPPPVTDAKRNTGSNEQESPGGLYWSAIHHKNLRGGLPTGQHPGLAKESADDDGPPKNNLNEQQHLLSTQSALTNGGYESTSGAPKILESENSQSSRRWDRIKESVETKELFIKYMAEKVDEGNEVTPSKKWSDFVNQDEFTLRECFRLFIVLLAIGVVAFSFVFEEWSIIDSLYFTTILLTTVGYGDLTPSGVGGKLFSSLFALVGIVLFGLALGVMGSQLVEAEIEEFEHVKSSTARVVETTLTRGSRRLGKKEKKKIDHYIQTGERAISKTDSEQSLGSTASFDSSSVDDLESLTPVARGSLSTEAGHNLTDKMGKATKKGVSRLSVIRRNLPGFVSIFLAGMTITSLEDWGWCDAFYYCVVTSTTIGFGDITPTSDWGKIFAILFVPIVVGAMGYILGNVASAMVEKRQEKMHKKLWSKELKIEDIMALDEGGDGGGMLRRS
mmetsp:Transcript_35154/g.74174  ORF Transcript_35154/g.74174 Transcript_35154/m.74174 type:complete len:467 (+) Transcript_35154:121-1521(+)